MSAGQNGSVSAVIRVRILRAKVDAWGQTCVATARGLVDIGAILQQQLDGLGCGPKLAGVVKGRFAVSIASVDKPRGLVAWKSVQERLQVADFIRDSFYVDDGGISVSSMENAHRLTEDTDAELSSVQMRVKGWTVSFNSPSPDVSDDGVSVAFAGMRWIPQTDSFSL